MGKRIGIVGFSLYLCITFALGEYYSKTRPFTPKQEVVTKLHFFFHDTLTSPNASAVLIAKPTLTGGDNSSSPSPFGSLFAVDDPLTVGPDPKSEKIGNARGMYVSSGKHAPTLTMYIDFGFTSGKFNGSSFSVFSRNTIMEKEREAAVVGGRGRFRMARGAALLNTYSVNLTNGDAIVEYHVTLYHY
ncbi:PREDICTED: dirigent protein 4-like [Camelina sativa]|uniref:Dirigent protein n=1 Tax=Camelina sativa TaxID=90675 RepID=A0ABM0TP53_CAMSA|nr:PREDICTED: dirigent protein 4-like [Camelina sativa]